MNDPSKEIWYYIEISNKKNVNIRKLKESSAPINNPYPDKNDIIKKRGKGTLTFQVCKLEDKQRKFKKENKIRANSYDCWAFLIDKIKEYPGFYLNQRFFYDYLMDYIDRELRYYQKVEKIIKLINKMEKERKIVRTEEEIKLIQKETEEVFEKEKNEELMKIFVEEDTMEILNSQSIIHTYELC